MHQVLSGESHCILVYSNDEKVLLVCRAENLQLQSSLADTQDEAQLLRRLLTLCNQALDDTDRQTEPAVREDLHVATRTSLQAGEDEQDEVIVHYNAASGYYRWPWLDHLQFCAQRNSVTWQV